MVACTNRASDVSRDPPQELDKDEIPTITRDGVTATVIAGEAFGVSSPVYTRTPTHYM